MTRERVADGARAVLPPRSFLIAVGIVSLAVGAGYLAFRGVRMGGDTGFYLDGAGHLLAGELPVEEKGIAYLGYMAVVALLQAVGVGVLGFALVHIVVAAFAAVAITDLTREQAGLFAGLVAGVLFAFNLDLVTWHTYILADSIFISTVSLSIWATYRAASRSEWWWSVGALLLVLFAASIKPHGWLLPPLMIAYWLQRRVREMWVRRLAQVVVVAGSVLTVVLVPALRAGVGAGSPTTMLIEGRVQWAPPEARLKMPPPPAGTDAGAGLAEAARYVAANPVATLRLAAARVATSLGHVRPYYSTKHNLAIVALLAPTYLLAAGGAWVYRRRSLTKLLCALVAANLVVIALTFADYDGRFLLYFLPALLVLAGSGAAAVRARFSRGDVLRAPVEAKG